MWYAHSIQQGISFLKGKWTVTTSVARLWSGEVPSVASFTQRLRIYNSGLCSCWTKARSPYIDHHLCCSIYNIWPPVCPAEDYTRIELVAGEYLKETSQMMWDPETASTFRRPAGHLGIHTRNNLTWVIRDQKCTKSLSLTLSLDSRNNLLLELSQLFSSAHQQAIKWFKWVWKSKEKTKCYSYVHSRQHEKRVSPLNNVRMMNNHVKGHTKC